MPKPYDTDQARQQGAQRLQQAKEALTGILNTWKEDPEVLAEALEFRGKFHQYSMRNSALIQRQNPGATFVSSIRVWNERGYRIKKGERGLEILFPQQTELFIDESGATKKLTEATAEERHQIAAGNLRRFTHTGFRVGTVFDISQTTCPPENYPRVYSVGYNSSQHAALYESVKRFAEKNGYTIIETDTPGGMPSISLRGLHSGTRSKIEINSRLQDTQRLDTLVHEVGHSLLHINPEDSQKPTAIKELEADGVSIMLASALGIEITEQRKRHFAANYEAASKLESFALEDMLPGIVSAFDTVWKGIEQEIAVQPELPTPIDRAQASKPQSASRPTAFHAGARFDAERMTQERLDALIAQGETSLYFENMIFQGIHFPKETGGRFVNCTFIDCDFSGTNVHAQFDKCSIHSAKTEGAFFHAGFQHCNISNTGFQNVRISSAFSDVTIRRCTAQNTVFENCFFDGGIMDHFSLLEGVTAINTQGLDTVKVTLSRGTEQEIEAYTQRLFAVLNSVHFGGIAEAESTAIPPEQAIVATVTPRIFLDMDGTLVRFHDDVRYIEHMTEPGFFADLTSYANTIEAVRQFRIHHPETEIFILSALIDTPYCEAEKNAWLNKHIPDIDAGHRIFVKAGENKANHIPGGVQNTDILIDDYNKNLTEWQNAGGCAVKFVNHVNDNGLNGEMWNGDRISYDLTAEQQEKALNYQVSTVKGRTDTRESVNAANQQFTIMCHVIHQYEVSVGMPQSDILVTLQFDGSTAYWAPRNGVSEEQIKAAAQQYGRWLEYGEAVDFTLSDAWKMDRSHLVMGPTPAFLGEYGFDAALPLMASARKLRKMTSTESPIESAHPHGLSVETIKRLPAAIANPAIVMISATRPEDSLVLVSSMIDEQNRPIIVSLRRGQGYIEMEGTPANIMTSAYGKDQFNDFLQYAKRDNRILYVDEKQYRELSRIPGIQIPSDLEAGRYPENIERFLTKASVQGQDLDAGLPTSEHSAPSFHKAAAGSYVRPLPNDTIDRIKQEIPIMQVIESCGYTLQRVGRHYNLKEHDSLIVYPETNSFHRFSTGHGGSSIDFLMQMQNMTQGDAIRTLASQLTNHSSPPPFQAAKAPGPTLQKELQLPPPCEGKYRRATAYLTKTRCIDPEVVTSLMRHKGHGSYLYQDERNNVVFVGFDSEGIPAYASRRSTLTSSNFKGEISGSNGNIGWFVDNKASKLYVTESAIDAMSLMTMRKEAGQAIESANYLSIGGVSKFAAVGYWLDHHPNIEEVITACDHDEAGQKCNQDIMALVKEHHPNVAVKIFDDFGDNTTKDLNEALCSQKQREKQTQQVKDVPLPFPKSNERGREVE